MPGSVLMWTRAASNRFWSSRTWKWGQGEYGDTRGDSNAANLLTALLGLSLLTLVVDRILLDAENDSR